MVWSWSSFALKSTSGVLHPLIVRLAALLSNLPRDPLTKLRNNGEAPRADGGSTHGVTLFCVEMLHEELLQFTGTGVKLPVTGKSQLLFDEGVHFEVHLAVLAVSASTLAGRPDEREGYLDPVKLGLESKSVV